VKDIKCTFGVDIDAVAGWLGSYGGEDSPSDIQRGMFAGELGTPRILNLFDKYGITASWFIPGHSIETFPKQTKMIADAGHEIGAHGYSHENPIGLTAKQEEDVLRKSVDLIEKISGKRPRGYVAPWWEMSSITAELLLKYGFQYDHSQAFNDFLPFYSRIGDTWTKIDLSKEAETWMKPLKRGRVIDLVEIGANWYLDDLPPMMFIKKSPNSHGFTNPHDVEQLWRDQFDWVYREMEYAVFAFTIHPDVSGRPQVLLMLERLIEYINGYKGVNWTTMEAVAADFRHRNPYQHPREGVDPVAI
jgi:peptidoglycan/xylan/chitin deacetylase (PgdA/CDA1 family)